MDFNKIIKEELTLAIEDIVRSQEKPILRGYEQLAEFIGVGKTTAYEIANLKNFPRHRIGKTTFYIKDEVIAYIRNTK